MVKENNYYGEELEKVNESLCNGKMLVKKASLVEMNRTGESCHRWTE